MRLFKFAAISAAALLAFSLSPTTPKAEAQISIGIGTAPVCPYGYYGYAPYNCAPYGYYGPEWFNGGVFIGSGPWYHGHDHFYGHVDNHFDPHHGYHGPYPGHNEHYRAYGAHDFHGGGMIDEHGNAHVEGHHR